MTDAADASDASGSTGAHVPLDLRRPLTVHLVGVGGSGMSAIAEVLAGMGHTVSGSDLRASAVVERLRRAGVPVAVGHDAVNLPADVDVVAVSTAVPASNPEWVAAVERGIPVLNRATVLAAIAATKRTVAVGGTHGKTTTSSMLALVLVEAGLHPSFIIGGDVNQIGTGAAWDEAGAWFVVEADESDGTFVALPRSAAVVTNVEPDHLEHWGGFGPLRDAFQAFLAGADGPRVVCADDPGAREAAAGLDVITYGTEPGADYRMVDVVSDRSGCRFGVEHAGARLAEVSLPVSGLHNARNATAAFTMGLALGATVEAATAALARFAGVARRFQYRGEAAGVTFVDDYAHLPTEVEAAIAAARDGDWRRVVCVFQPHRYSRTASLWSTFGDAFAGADQLVVTDVYAAGEAPRPGVSGKLVADAVLDAHPRTALAYLPHRADLVRYLTDRLRPGDLCLTLGAGDLTTLSDEVRDRLAGE